MFLCPSIGIFYMFHGCFMPSDLWRYSSLSEGLIYVTFPEGFSWGFC